ncbi:MAG: hypothetical protein ACM3SR_17820 [Ignavibacteriales bacterium]
MSFVRSMNLKRRTLTPSQLAVVATELLPFYEEEARKRQAHGLTAPGKTLTQKLRKRQKAKQENTRLRLFQ